MIKIVENCGFAGIPILIEQRVGGVCMDGTVNDFSEIDEAALLAAMDAEPLLVGLSADERRVMLGLVAALVEGQKVMNLTAIKDPVAMVRYHLADSMALAAAVEAAGVGLPRQAVDIGTGAGFPLLPLAAVWRDTAWVGIESTGKKAAYVSRTAQGLGMDNVMMLAERAETVGGGHYRESFELVTSRAVGSVSALLEVGLPLVAEHGRLYLFKTESTRPEWEMCKKFADMLGGRYVGEYAYGLEGDEQRRVIYVVEKIEPTPWDFPRVVGDAFKKPMVKPPEVKR